MEFGPKTFDAATSLDALEQANAAGKPADYAYTFYEYLVQCFPSLQGSKRSILETAFQRVQLDEMIELMWDDASDLRSVPKEYSSTLTYHATSPLRVPAIRQFGLLPSATGAGSTTPALYTSPLRFTCMRSYNSDVFSQRWANHCK